MKKITLAHFEHYGNPLHIYCRLRNISVPPALAMRISQAYAKIFNRVHRKLKGVSL